VTLEIWVPVLSLQLSDLSIGIILGVIGHFWQQGLIVEELQLLGHGTFLIGGLAFLRPIYTCIKSSLYIQPLEAYCSLLLEHIVAALLSIFLAIC
jgi:hypothetical protein